jgi:hypothetical protein|tara:strand:+ start:2444 stop:3013 length:570 start_codon:yes stop_codon:yes gene_type:complete
MPLWGKAAAGTQAQKPKFIGTTEGAVYNKQGVYATNEGWAINTKASKNASASPEILVAMGGLGTTLAAPSITSMRFTAAAITGGSRTVSVQVTYDERVTVTGSPTVSIANGNQGSGSGRGPHVCVYASGSGTNRLTFTKASETVATSDVLTLGGANILLAGGTVKDTTDATTAALLVLTGMTAVTLTVT